MARSKISQAGAGAVAGMAAVVVLLASGCGAAAIGAAKTRTAQWDDITDYTYTLRYFDGRCGDRPKSAWSITVKDSKTTGVKPLNTAARNSGWDEAPPTLKKAYNNALGVKKDGAYDTVRIGYDDGTYDRRPASVYYLDRGRWEGCETYTDFQPATPE
ncbi:hypothetical protein GCM10009872_44190 [Actinopolymorpha rutila]